MKTLDVSFSDELDPDKDLLKKLAEQLPTHKLDCVSWVDFPYKPNVTFNIAYSEEAIFVRFDVQENVLRINNYESNQPVYEDSCVEFFISFSDQHYYNLEFNAIGIGLVGYGTNDKTQRQRLSSERIHQIKTFSNISKNGRGEDVKWSLMIYIPIELFKEESVSSLKGRKAMANFYKCGDMLPEPHYISWSPIQADEPNFHLPEYFGQVNFNF